jgi:hypothetical protein
MIFTVTYERPAKKELEKSATRLRVQGTTSSGRLSYAVTLPVYRTGGLNPCSSAR